MPTSLAYWLETNLGLAYWMTTLIEGTLQIGLLLTYLWAIGQMPEIRRLFGYHGAEHQTIHAYEADAPLTPAAAGRFPLAHPRCGTAFILTVAVIAILIFSLIGPLPLGLRIASRSAAADGPVFRQPARPFDRAARPLAAELNDAHARPGDAGSRHRGLQSDA